MKRVYRSRHTKVLGGVAAGLADYFSIDVTVMRVLFALVLVTIPNAIIAYILAWIIIPEEPAGISTNSPKGAAAIPNSATTAPGGATMGGATMTNVGETPNSGKTADEILRNQVDPYVPDVPGAPQAGQMGQSDSTPVSPAAQTPVQARSVSPVPADARQNHGSDRSRQLLGYILIAIGGIVIFKRLVPSFVFRLPGQLIGQAWPLLIILAGIAIIYGAVRGR